MVESHRQEIAKLEALYASNPGGRVFVHLAEALRRAGEQERARSILEEGLARHPDSASGYVVLGRVLLDRGERPAAETAFRKVLQLDSGNLVALRNLGDLAREGGRPTDAVTYYRELIARNPASEGDTALMRLLDEMQRAAAAAALAEVAARHEAAQAAAAVAEAAEKAPPKPAAAEADSEPSAAPGRTGRAEPAEPEFGMIALDALPGDLASFAGLVAAESEFAFDESEPEPRGLEDDVVVMIESSAAPLELEELESQLAAAPADVHLLSVSPELETEPPSPAAELTDLLEAIASEPEVPASEKSGDIDVDAAMLDVDALSTATPFEVIPEATELTLIDDDSVRVAMPAAEAASQAPPADMRPEPEAADVAPPETPAEPEWVTAAAASEPGDDARTQDEAELTLDAAEADATYEDLPWLVDPADAAGSAFGVGEETSGFADTGAYAASAAAEPIPDFIVEEPAVETPAAAAPDAADELPAAAAAADSADAVAVPFDFVSDFEGPAEEPAAEAAAPLPAGEAEAARGASDAEAAPETVSGEAEDAVIEAWIEITSFTGFEVADEAAADEAASEQAAAGEAERGIEAAEPAEAAPDRDAWEPREWAADAPDVESGDAPTSIPELAGDVSEDEPAAAAPDFADSTPAEPPYDTVELILAETELHVLAVPPDAEPAAEPERARFAEDVEAEPDLATFMEDVAATRNAAGFVPDDEFAMFDERGEPEAEPSFAEEIPVQARDTTYVEDVEAETELAGFADEIEVDAEFPGYANEPGAATPSWLDDDAAALVDEVAEPAWTEAEIDVAPLPDLAPLGADIGVSEPVRAEQPPETPPSAAASGTEMGTETLGDLYRAQGFAERAAEVYGALLRQRPFDERLAAKLRDAEAALAGRGADTGEDAGDVWLRGVESAWTGGAGATGQETTPYAWTEREEREQETGIGSYLRNLIGWGTGGVTEDVAAEVPPAESDEQVSGSSITPETDTGWAAAADAGGAQAPWDEEPDLPAAPPEAVGPWSMASDPVIEEAWSGSEPDEPWAEEADLPADPWQAPESAPLRAISPEPPRGDAPNAVEEAFNEWFGATSEPPPTASAPAGKARPAPASPGADRGEGGAEDEDDEDLEMFRAWLQSLKK